jgi:predicted heme/steroid binding protein
MYYSTPFSTPCDYCRASLWYRNHKTLDHVMALVNDSILKERQNQILLNYLISAANTQKEKSIISSIRDNKRKHIQYLSEIYNYIFYLNGNSDFNGCESDIASNYFKEIQGAGRQTKEFTLEELSNYNGSMGKPAYVAVNGVVYDVSREAAWGGASHFGLMAGKDLSSQFQGCHGNESVLAKLPKVGILKE